MKLIEGKGYSMYDLIMPVNITRKDVYSHFILYVASHNYMSFFFFDEVITNSLYLTMHVVKEKANQEISVC